jgi:ATP-dependent Clp protease ATP-binding subunit ClpA
MFERMTARSPFARVITSALEEARRRGDRRVGTDHLLLGLLRDPGSAPARARGGDVEAARAALDALDRAALASIGVDVGGVLPAVPARRHPALTLSALSSGARSAIDESVKATRVTTRRLAPAALLLALLSRDRPDPAAELLAKLAIDAAAVRGRMDQPAA